MSAPDPSLLGPLGGLVGTWDGDAGLDVSCHHDSGIVAETVYRERATFNPFRPPPLRPHHLAPGRLTHPAGSGGGP